jgi:hypothetical protein
MRNQERRLNDEHWSDCMREWNRLYATSGWDSDRKARLRRYFAVLDMVIDHGKQLTAAGVSH